MAASYYRTPAEQHLLSPGLSSTGLPSPSFPSPGYSSGQSSPLKPLHLVPSMDDMEEIKAMRREDERLKSHIRRLRLISRIIAFCISIAIFIPITLTLHKFITTKDVYRDVSHPDGSTVSRTAWAKDSKVWPTYMYFAVAAFTVLLHFIILLSYKFGVGHANKAATVATTFSWVVMIGNLVVWSVAAGLYRREKDLGGKSNDLWGWTCSAAAEAIQKEFVGEVNFDKFCNVQSVSWYAGLVQVGAAFLTIFIYVLVWRRRQTKKKVKRQTRMLTGFERVRR
ncbi:uncharacterized protein BDR25DRAFT_306070 [Lindgomyces ingoldianus]|uniref:Uncharacterized protein n=1 Tax=Lindgomyces ingoldianus TaxID=673940 RepID=A0ACB6QI27_9PLEO|nr:uncharacterized protein BDR25DRAFT_306070 [Lindgomyces ingoldianus]KAF2466545.1 hypothetical protein BDR25DRAFT_306070 [Lindgomyces ingoldianus]